MSVVQKNRIVNCQRPTNTSSTEVTKRKQSEFIDVIRHIGGIEAHAMLQLQIGCCSGILPLQKCSRKKPAVCAVHYSSVLFEILIN